MRHAGLASPRNCFGQRPLNKWDRTDTMRLAACLPSRLHATRNPQREVSGDGPRRRDRAHAPQQVRPKWREQSAPRRAKKATQRLMAAR